MPWLKLAIVAGIAILAGLLWVQTARLDAAHETAAALTKQRDQWRQNAEDSARIADENAKAAREAFARQIKAEEIAGHAMAANERMVANIEDLRGRIRNVRPEDDGPVRRGLCDALNGLRHIAGAAGPACN